ncbi:MAG: site-2 protease family protein [Thermoguttaceae bacterium]|jgi:membrane-associated protease RseP (regulator of RpoE activity)
MDNPYLNENTGTNQAGEFDSSVVELVRDPVSDMYVQPPRRRRVWLPVGLLVVTCASTFAAPLVNVEPCPSLWEAFEYSAAIMTILLCHEMGHFLQAWRYGVYASLPYFIPMPASPIGTFGAVIVMEPHKGNRRQVFDIGISGPLAGLVPTLIFMAVGLHLSQVVPASPQAVDSAWRSSPLFNTLAQWFLYVPPGYHGGELAWHPLCFAGWVGMLITAINLIPVGQLDGGHVLYGMLRSKARGVAVVVLLAAVVAAAVFWLYWWWLMLFLMIMLGTRHPPTADDDVPLGWWRYVLGWLTLCFLPLGFVPDPFGLMR